MFFFSFLLLLIPLVSSTSRHSMHRMRKVHTRAVDTTLLTGQWDSVHAGQYSLFNDLWDEKNATWGSQESQITSFDGSNIGWTTTYTWTGGSQVKTFANVQLNNGINQQLSAISSMPTNWQWTQSTNEVVADVAYDLFTSGSPGGSNVNEIMVWLASINSGPISAEYNAEGQAVPIVTNISLEGYTWDLYSGFNGVNQVYSFLLTSGVINSFSGDIYPFLSYLIDNKDISSTQYLTCAQGGTEVISGTAQFTTSSYSLAVN
ncbi:glycoside hydrolase family 12 protein [Suillus plorans]|uniref:Glycoside hydrolase family 12 protein n=1 Tax=Suillus plorans TaxID=116603 RepID=A0A9P7APY9_9AGAM|nr:glycoside hydrolase family 12 protein [Suillus plorans]KAG1793202.1 glycoside hydrolase family 12 protein [Suillus plorans]